MHLISSNYTERVSDELFNPIEYTFFARETVLIGIMSVCDLLENDKAPMVSILIASFNNGRYLQNAIDSVLMQLYKNWEIIIVDDKSTDDSVSVYNKFKDDARFHVFFNDVNRGVGYTKRRCVEMSNGEICCFLDPDDVLVGEDVLNVMVDMHLTHPKASMVYSGMYRGDEHLSIKRESPGMEIYPYESSLHTRSWPFHPVLTFKKSAYNKTEGIDSFMRNAEDYDLYYKLEEVGDVIHIDRLQYIQRENPHSISLNDNSYKAAVWHSYACINALKRRGFFDESLVLFPVEYALRNAYLKGYEKAISSRIYRIGKALVSPVLSLSKIWKK